MMDSINVWTLVKVECEDIVDKGFQHHHLQIQI